MVPNMSKKKVFLLLIILVVMTSLFSNTVFGQQEGLGGTAETIHKLFGFIPLQTQVTAVVSAETGELVATENVGLMEKLVNLLSID